MAFKLSIYKLCFLLPETRNRISKAAGAFNKLNNFWKNKNSKQNTKLNIYRSNVLSVLLYGAETWTMTREPERRLASFHTKCLRRLLKIRWNDFITNIKVREKANAEDVITTIKGKDGHTWDMPYAWHQQEFRDRHENGHHLAKENEGNQE